MDNSKDYYKILGIREGATKQQIKEAYWRLAKKYHPDINKSDDSVEKFKEINEAYSFLIQAINESSPEEETKGCHYHNGPHIGKLKKCRFCGDYYCEKHSIPHPPKVGIGHGIPDEVHPCPDCPDCPYCENKTNHPEPYEDPYFRKGPIWDPPYQCNKCGKWVTIDTRHTWQHVCTPEPPRPPPPKPPTPTEKPTGPKPKNESRKHSTKRISPLLLVLILVLVIIGIKLLFLDKIDETERASNCSDKTASGFCSLNEPYYCDNGKLVINETKCKCDEGFRIFEGECIKKVSCIDGTLHPECSKDRPYQCINGSLVLNAKKCGCPNGLELINNYCKKAINNQSDTSFVNLSSIKVLRENKTDLSFIDKIISKITNLKNEYTPYVKPAYIQLKSDINSTIDDIKKEYMADDKESCQFAFDKVNELRTSKDRRKMRWNDDVYEVALIRAKDMYDRNYFSHETPEGWDVGHYLGAPWGYSENIAEGYYTCKDAVDGWIDSPGHYANLFFGNEGAIAQYGSYYVYVSIE